MKWAVAGLINGCCQVTKSHKKYVELNLVKKKAYFQSLLHSANYSDTQQMAFEFVMSTGRALSLWQTEVSLQAVNYHLNEKVTSAF